MTAMPHRIAFLNLILNELNKETQMKAILRKVKWNKGQTENGREAEARGPIDACG